MMTIVRASSNDFKIIRDIAYRTWPDTYGQILSQGQLDYMLEMMYSIEALQRNAENGHESILIKEFNVVVGFATYEHHYFAMNVTRLHRLYLIPEVQGRGAGRMLIATVEQSAKENGSEAVSLNVNKFNKAYAFYVKSGYIVVGEENIEIGQGYLMEDYKMEKRL